MAGPSLESLLLRFGNPGRRQMIIASIILLQATVITLVLHFVVLIAYIPQHQCKRPVLDWLFDDSFAEESRCLMPRNVFNLSEGLTSCKFGWKYQTLAGEIYPANEFNLVCERQFLLFGLLSVCATGIMIGGLIFGYVADVFGRKKTMAVVLFILSAAGLAFSFAPNFLYFAACFIVLGICEQGLQTAILSYNTELFGRRMRTITMSAYGFLVAVLLPIAAGLLLLFRDWRYVPRIYSGLSFLAGVLTTFFLPESVAWLVMKGKADEATTVLTDFARVNNLPLPEDLRGQLISHAKQIEINRRLTSQTKWYHLFSNKTVTLVTLGLLFVWFVSWCALTGGSYAISTLPGNMYANYAFNGLIQIVLQVMVLLGFMRFPRVKLFFTMFFLGGILTIAGYLLKFYVRDHFGWQMTATVLALISRDLMSVLGTMIAMYSSEILPTKLRSTGLSLCSAAGKLGGVVSPQILYLLGNKWEPLPHIAFGSLMLTASVVMCFLPETFNRALPHDIQDMEKLARRRIGSNSIQESEPLVQDKQYIQPSKDSALHGTAKDIANILGQ